MSLDREGAQKALAEIDAARGRVDQTHGYRDVAPFFFIWGAIWLVANLVTEFAPRYSGLAWMAGWVIGMPAGIWLTVALAQRWIARARVRRPDTDFRTMGLRIALSEAAVFGFLSAVFLVAGPLDGRQTNALITVFWTLIYMAAGAWIGWRLFTVGAATTAAVLFGYVALREHYFLWMGVVAGGGLILGGLWLRKI